MFSSKSPKKRDKVNTRKLSMWWNPRIESSQPTVCNNVSFDKFENQKVEANISTKLCGICTVTDKRPVKGWKCLYTMKFCILVIHYRSRISLLVVSKLSPTQEEPPFHTKSKLKYTLLSKVISLIIKSLSKQKLAHGLKIWWDDTITKLTKVVSIRCVTIAVGYFLPDNHVCPKTIIIIYFFPGHLLKQTHISTTTFCTNWRLGIYYHGALELVCPCFWHLTREWPDCRVCGFKNVCASPEIRIRKGQVWNGVGGRYIRGVVLPRAFLVSLHLVFSG